MVRCFGALVDSLPCVDAMRADLPSSWLATWETRHATVTAYDQIRKSLGGLWLLYCHGARGALTYTANGRPYFADSTAFFSITHTERFVFCALSDAEDGEIGIDAESLSRIDPKRINGLVTRWFSTSEREQYAVSPTKETFLRLWTRKEAYVKRTGEGLRALRAADTVSLEAHLQFRSVFLKDTCITVCTRKGVETLFNVT